MCVYIYTYMYAHICIYIYVCTNMCVCMYVSLYIYIYLHAYVCICMYRYECVQIYNGPVPRSPKPTSSAADASVLGGDPATASPHHRSIGVLKVGIR